MRIVLNTRSDTAGAQASIVGLAQRLREAGADATLNDWDAYGRYDVAIFMGYDHELEAARAANPAIRVGLSDPKQSRPDWIRAAREADFLLVSSVEQREAFLRLNRNVHVLYMFPVMPVREHVHSDGGAIVLGYHGNRVHLEAMAETVSPAIEELGRRRPVELVCVYDVKGGRPSAAALPDPSVVPTRHVQYGGEPVPGATVPSVFDEELATADIGIVPNLLPLRDVPGLLRRSAELDPSLAYEPFDHLLRLKASSNPNRLYAFGRLGIPVVADVTPSFAQFVLDGVSGCLAAGPGGWFQALELLAGSAELRTRMAGALRERLDQADERMVPDLLAFLAGEPLGPPVALPGVRAVEDDLARLGTYARPSNRPGRERLRARVERLRRR